MIHSFSSSSSVNTFCETRKMSSLTGKLHEFMVKVILEAAHIVNSETSLGH